MCIEHNLSVVIPGQKRGLHYAEWLNNKSDTSWKTQIKKDIDDTIKSSNNYDHFILLMKAKGYEIKGEDLGPDSLKYIYFKPIGKERFVRGSAKSLGTEYTKERINERINSHLEKTKNAQHVSSSIDMNKPRTRMQDLIKKKSAKELSTLLDQSERQIIDTSQDKFENNPYLKQ